MLLLKTLVSKIKDIIKSKHFFKSPLEQSDVSLCGSTSRNNKTRGLSPSE